ncbi:MAG: hypothetical protein KJ864_01295, partial [Candidatus Omnitrophica bacterium]|nr:hypothetical protein [Candidatus Omnitrophota bacterium]
MRKDRFLLIKIFLSLLILLSFSTIVKALNHQILIITPVKYERIAQQFLDLHDSDIFPADARLRGCYVLVEEIAGSYGGTDQPPAAGNPPCPTLTEDRTGIDYENELSPKVIKFLRGALLFQTELNNTGAWGNSRDYALNRLYDKAGNRGLSPADAKFDYLLLLGETGALGPGAVTLNGVPESWYVYMDDREYDQSPDADNTWFPTDFFYASPDYEAPNQDTPLWQDLWIPNLRVGRIPIYDDDFLDTGIVTELNTIDEEDIYNQWGVLDECDVCDSQRAAGGSREAMAWIPEQWRGDGTDTPAYELVIISEGNPATDDEDAPIDASYLILDNTETCLRVLGTPEDDGVEGETEDGLDDGDGFEIRNLIGAAQKAYEKSRDYMIEITASPYPSTTWNGWFRKVVTAGGDSFPHLFSFWDEFVLAQITNEGSFEGNELIKLRHTNKDNSADTTHNFDTTSFLPYIDGSEDCGLIVHLGEADYDDRLTFDDDSITSDTVLGYAPKTRLPIIVSNASGVSGNYYFGAALFDMASPAFGAAAVQSDGGAIAFIGSTDLVYSGITPSFSNGVLSQERLYNFDELLSYTVKAFHDAPKFIGDMFMGSQSSSGKIVNGPLIGFITSNGDTDGQLSFWANQKTIYQYTLLGDPALPIPYPQPTTIETATDTPLLTFPTGSLRDRIPQYESHDIGVDEMTDGVGGSASTTVQITSLAP